MEGITILLSGSIILCLFISYAKPTDEKLNVIAVSLTAIINSIIWHIIGYLKDNGNIITWITITIPVTCVISFILATVTSFMFQRISLRNIKKKR